ncbi:MAG: class I SAM-dependent methyltransferase, partial [Proteobacteria bacterium]|nr:class I SAM-dependent methyltransferase [Pseudomonadota bacterium]
MQAITTNITDAVADTLFIPLYMRCLETGRPDAIISDPDACRIVGSLDYDFSKYDKATRSQVGVCLRVKHFDGITRRFIDAHDDPVIVSIGCGLDSRANRLGPGRGFSTTSTSRRSWRCATSSCPQTSATSRCAAPCSTRPGCGRSGTNTRTRPSWSCPRASSCTSPKTRSDRSSNGSRRSWLRGSCSLTPAPVLAAGS